MRSLLNAVLKEDHSGEPIPLPFKSWTDAGMGFWRGDLVMLAGPPGIGKSTVALTVAARNGLPTLYLSADSSETTQAVRVISMMSGVAARTVKQQMDEMGKREFFAQEWVKEALRRASHIKWNYKAQPTLMDLDDEVDTFTLVHGEPPALIVIDNASNVAFDSGDEFASLRELMRQMKVTARENNCCVVVLHHTSESFLGDPCPPLHSIHGKISQEPAVVITFGQPQEGYLAACPVKNRNDYMDRTGRNAIWLEYQPGLMLLRDQEAR